MISYGKQSIDKEDIDSVVKCLKSNYLTQGPLVKKFELKLSKYLGFKFCSVVTNGTSAMFLISKLLKWIKKIQLHYHPLHFYQQLHQRTCKAKPLFY